MADLEDEDPTVRRMRLEAILLLAKSPLSLRKLAQMAHLADATEARTLVRQLNRTYDEYGRAVRVEQVAGGYRMLTRPALSPLNRGKTILYFCRPRVTLAQTGRWTIS